MENKYMDNNNYEKDPSWGMIELSRLQGNGSTFFQSDVSTPNYIGITIKTAEKKRSEFSRDFVIGGQTICDIKLTPLQWAELLTDMNVGEGVPCTIHYTREEGYIKFKPEPDKLELIYKEQSDKVDAVNTGLDKLSEKLKALNAAKKISGKAFEELDFLVKNCKYNMEQGASIFAKKQAKEEIDNIVAQANANITAYTEHKIRAAGLEALKYEFPKLKIADTEDLIKNNATNKKKE